MESIALILARELRGHDKSVNSVALGPIATEAFLLHHSRYAALLERALSAYWISCGYAVDSVKEALDSFHVVRINVRPVGEI